MNAELYLWGAIFAIGGALLMAFAAEAAHAGERRRWQERYRSAIDAGLELGQELHDLEAKHRPGFVAPPEGPAEDVR